VVSGVPLRLCSGVQKFLCLFSKSLQRYSPGTVSKFK